MDKSKKKILIGIIIIQLLLFSNILQANGDIPVIASRVSKISEIKVDDDPRYLLPNHTLFSFDAEVEILNRGDENQTVTELGDFDPKVRIYASLVNQSIEMIQDASYFTGGTEFTYSPGITTEYEPIRVYINQTGLSHLPDGNYTLDRPINTASKYGTGEPAEVLLTFFQMISGIINITYTNFTVLTLPEETSAFSIQLTTMFLISIAILVVRRKRTKVHYK
ncbi:MAG: hypothetical protein ACTSVO_13710 [Candidatus Heimdallarchaeaceae archaeon]